MLKELGGDVVDDDRNHIGGGDDRTNAGPDIEIGCFMTGYVVATSRPFTPYPRYVCGAVTAYSERGISNGFAEVHSVVPVPRT